MSFHKQLDAKIANWEIARERLDALRAQKKRIVFTNGCFDILHPGHVDYLCQARDLGDFLLLALNSDHSMKKLQKAPGSPVNDEQTRVKVLSGLACVDLIVLFDELTPFELIKQLQPDVLVKGGDYKIEEIAGHDLVQAAGGKVVTIPLLEGYSTTNLIKKITNIKRH